MRPPSLKDLMPVGFAHVLGPGEVDGGEGDEGVDGEAEFNEEDDV